MDYFQKTPKLKLDSAGTKARYLLKMQEFINKRNIENLMHFTRTKNLRNITQYGILSIDELKAKKIETIINDEIRIDYCTSASSVSIEFPNYKMFYKLRMDDENEEWAIICLSSKILLDKKCAFCYDNAANKKISSIPIERRNNLGALKNMFRDIEGLPTRKERRLKRFYTTMPQAEVLVFDKIDVSYFKSIIFKDRITMNQYKDEIIGNIKCEVIPDYFYAREDHSYWQ